MVARLLALSLCAAGLVACRDTASPKLPLAGPCESFQRPAQTGALQVFGVGFDTVRYTGEIAVRGTTAYTSTWNARRAVGNAIDIWDVSGDCPQFIDSLIVPNAVTIGDLAISDDGTLLVAATEFSPGSIVTYDLADPRHPVFLSRFTNSQTTPGVHTAEVGRVNGKLYAFLSVDESGANFPSRMVIVDLSDPSAPAQVYAMQTGNPFVHDSFLRDGLLFVALWNDGLEIWDLGGGGFGGTPQLPLVLGRTETLGGETHNVWWYHDASGSKRFAFVGEEGPGSLGSTSRGDIHVVDVSNLLAPVEVAFYHVDGAGTHNFSVDEVNGVLYAAYYNGGVRAIDVRGDLSTCEASQRVVDGATGLSRCDLGAMGRELAVGLTNVDRPTYIWGVQYLSGTVYASDMINGIWKLGAAR